MKKNPVEVLIIGAGNRGMYKFGELCKREDINMKVVGVADPDDEKREKMKKEHNIPEENCFKSGEQALKQKRFCDAVINATPDKKHHKISIMALEKGYNLLLEKPMATTAKDCVDIVNAQKKSGKVLSVAHVLRYSPFFQELKKFLDSKELGNMLDIELLEEVGYWHFAHSFVRGNWRKKKDSGPVILTKSCHDMDILTWLIGGDIGILSSTGSLKRFKRQHAPMGSTKRCTEKCKVKKTCPYNAERFYLSVKDPGSVKWPLNVISPIDKSIKARKKALKEGQYGRCVWKCDNDVCDNQNVNIDFLNGVNARFKLTAFGAESTRKIRIYLEGGEIHGDLGKGNIRIIKYKGIKGGDEIKNIEVSAKGAHGGGDEFLLKSFVKAISEKDKASNLTTAKQSLQSHLMAFAAEQSRLKKGDRINFQKYRKRLGLKSKSINIKNFKKKFFRR